MKKKLAAPAADASTRSEGRLTGGAGKLGRRGAAGRLRLSLAVALAVAVGALGLVGVASAAVDARLGGAFNVKATIVAGDGPPPAGTVVKRTYKFTPLCGSGRCDEVRIARQTSTGSFVKTKLTRVAPGTYEGTEVQADPRCADGSNAISREGDIHVEIVDRSHGKATKIKGTLSFVTQGCDDTFQEAKFTGKAA